MGGLHRSSRAPPLIPSLCGMNRATTAPLWVNVNLKSHRVCVGGGERERENHSLGSEVSAMAHEHSGWAPTQPDPPGGRRMLHPQESAAEADWPSQRPPPLPVAAAAAGQEAPGVCWASAAVGSENGVPWGGSDGAEALSCVLARESLFGWVGSEGTSWAGWWWWRAPVVSPYQGHYRGPWSLQALTGCWPGEEGALICGSAAAERTQRSEVNPQLMLNTWLTKDFARLCVHLTANLFVTLTGGIAGCAPCGFKPVGLEPSPGLDPGNWPGGRYWFCN